MTAANQHRRAAIAIAKRTKTRAALVTAAMTVFARVGLDAATTDEIINEAGVSRGTFYNYFKTVEDVIAVVATDLTDDMNETIAERTRGLGNAADMMAVGLGSFLSRAAADPIWGSVLVHLAHKNAPEPVGTATSSNLIGTFRLGRKQGVFTVADDRVASDLVLGGSMYALRSIVEGRYSSDQIRSLIEQLLGALGTPKHIAQVSAQLAVSAGLERKPGHKDGDPILG
jgi:AcrR family transcriptional regulator